MKSWESFYGIVSVIYVVEMWLGMKHYLDTLDLG